MVSQGNTTRPAWKLRRAASLFTLKQLREVTAFFFFFLAILSLPIKPIFSHWNFSATQAHPLCLIHILHT